MGYRSDVMMCIVGKEEDMKTQLASLMLTSTPVIQEALREMVLAPYSHSHFMPPDIPYLSLTYQNEGSKWYSKYSDVKAFMAIWSHFQDLDVEVSPFDGAFIRVGEEDNDIESEYFGDFSHNLGYAHTSIHCSAATEPSKDIRHNRPLQTE